MADDLRWALIHSDLGQSIRAVVESYAGPGSTSPSVFNMSLAEFVQMVQDGAPHRPNGLTLSIDWQKKRWYYNGQEKNLLCGPWFFSNQENDMTRYAHWHIKVARNAEVLRRLIVQCKRDIKKLSNELQ